MSSQMDTLRARAAAIRLSRKDLAARAGLDEDNVGRVLRGKNDARTSTLHALDRALCEEEQRLLSYLSNLQRDHNAEAAN